MGYAASIGVAMLVIMMVFTVVYANIEARE
jgi:ABC-type sugar transport system permease subunit